MSTCSRVVSFPGCWCPMSRPSLNAVWNASTQTQSCSWRWAQPLSSVSRRTVSVERARVGCQAKVIPQLTQRSLLGFASPHEEKTAPDGSPANRATDKATSAMAAPGTPRAKVEISHRLCSPSEASSVELVERAPLCRARVGQRSRAQVATILRQASALMRNSTRTTCAAAGISVCRRTLHNMRMLVPRHPVPPSASS